MNLFESTQAANKEVSKLIAENPDFALWQSLYNQIGFIQQDFDEKGVFKKRAELERVSELILGIQAVREVEANNPELAELLCDIDYEYKSLYGLVDV